MIYGWDKVHHYIQVEEEQMDTLFTASIEKRNRQVLNAVHGILFGDIDAWFRYYEALDYRNALAEPEWDVFV